MNPCAAASPGLAATPSPSEDRSAEELARRISEIEQAIERHPLVAMAAVIGVADPLYSEVGHAFVIPGNAELTVEDLKAHCSHELANYKRPKRFTIRQDLPMLANGKIDKLALKALVTPQE